jgi:hypothetical protein
MCTFLGVGCEITKLTEGGLAMVGFIIEGTPKSK